MSYKKSPSAKQSPNTSSSIDNCQRVTLLSNLFKVDFKQSTKVYIFSIKTTPEIPQENSKKFRSLLSAQRGAIEKLAGPYVVSGRTIFGSKSSGSKSEIGVKIDWQGQTYQISLKLARQISLSQIYSTEKDKSGPVFSFLNNLLRNMFHELDYSQIGRSRKFFDLSSKKKLEGANVTLFKGYSSNFKLLQGGLYLRLDPAVKVIQSTSVLQAINSIYTMHPTLSKTQKRMLVEEALIGKTVMANYAKNRCYIVEQVVFGESLDNYQFHDGNKSIKLLEYYKETYNIDVTVKAQPLLKASVRKTKNGQNFIILIPQLMLLSGIPDDFDERKRKMVSDVTIVQPASKLDDIQNIFDRFSQNNSNAFSPSTIGEKLGINLHSEPTPISAKMLPYPELQLGDRQKVDDSRSTCFNLFSKKLFARDVPLNICLFHANDYDLMQVKRLMESTTRGMGLGYSLNCISINFGDSKALRNIEGDLRKEKEKGKTNLFWFIIPSTFKSQYKHIKRMTLRQGIQVNSQVTLVNTLRSKNFASIFTKVLLQMSAKIGNKLWVPKVSPSIQRLGVLVIGIQQTKDSETKGSTVVSYCCNINKDFSSFHSNYIYVHKDKNSTLMKEVMFDCLNTFINSNNGFPQEVILLKNGTAKNDFGTNIDTEVKQVKQILRSVVDSANSNKLTYILLDKNPSQKFFLQKGRDIVNPASGALINSQAVGKDNEFYLIAQQCNRGTVKPTYYRIVYSESTLEQGAIEELIYSQCFNYMNWTGAVKVPSVLQNAKKLGAFVGQYLNTELKMEGLHNNLYYI